MNVLFALFLLSCVGFAKGTRLEIVDVVKSMESENERESILFERHAAIYRLSKTSKNYSVLKKKLMNSLKDKQNIKVTADPVSLEIEKISTNKKGP